MTTPGQATAKQVEQKVVNKAKQAANSPWIERLMRFGYFVRGLIYMVIGVLALQLAAGAGGQTTSPTSAIELIGKQPSGRYMLMAVAVGLAGYSLWGFVRAIFDPLRRGSDGKGLVERAGFLFSGLSYGALLIPVLMTLAHKATPASTGGVPSGLTSGPMGKWVMVALGLVWLAIGAAQLFTAYKAHFVEDLKAGRLRADQLNSVTWMGRLGFAARGIVFGLVGVIILKTALVTGGAQNPGFDGALAALAHGPSGAVVLGLVAAGLVLFGVFSIVCAWVAKVGARRAT